MTKENYVTSTSAKFIKLGEKGRWEKLCLNDGTLRLGFYEVPHDMAISNDKESIRDIYLETGTSKGKASDYARQITDFYNPDPETIWVTFSNGYMWWCKASTDIEFLSDDKDQHPTGSKLRRALSGWKNTSINGIPLSMSKLSGRLTKVVAYRGTICAIEELAFEYLMRKINGQLLPQVEQAKQEREKLKLSTKELIRLLTWQNFELFVELIFSQSGWQRISATGATQKTIDLELIQPLTNAKAIVQVKSSTDQQQLNTYIDSLSAHDGDNAFYVYHSSPKELSTNGSDVILMDVSILADCALRSGLVDWLIDKTG